MKKIQMVDLKTQYEKIETAIDRSIKEVITDSSFINGPQVGTFEKSLAEFLKVKQAIGCANGTDALQIAMMALELKAGDEIIVPAFTYIASVEAAALLSIKPILVDVDPDTFNMDPSGIEAVISKNTKAILPVHLFGQCASMNEISEIAAAHHLAIIEDNAQALGSSYTMKAGKSIMGGTIGDIGITSFFPSKNLGCYGDGGALMCNDETIAKKIRMIANHGQEKKYYHEIIGVNSRLDTLQAAILNVKIKELNHYIESRQKVADAYDEAFAGNKHFTIPSRNADSTHVFHQYTLKLNNNRRDEFQAYLQKKDIPSMVYYPLPIHFQKAFSYLNYKKGAFPVAERLSQQVISLPIHTEMDEEQINYIAEIVLDFFK